MSLDEWRAWPNFKPLELCCRGSGLLRLHPGFMDELQALREALAEPMIVTSGCRSEAHNRSVGGHPRSMHICDRPQHDGQLGTLAVDIRATGAYRDRLFDLAAARGWSIGRGRGFLHLDRRDMIGLSRAEFNY